MGERSMTELSLEKPIYSLHEIFQQATFKIPQYQRAYSWERYPQLEAFLEDLRQQARANKKERSKGYYLGTLLLHDLNREGKNEDETYDVVDGQQRLTTAVIFIATALELTKSGKISLPSEMEKILENDFIKNEKGIKFKTIEEDQTLFTSQILGVSPSGPDGNTPSAPRLLAAKKYFKEEGGIKEDEWPFLLKVLLTAKIMVYVVHNTEEATQLFELQNDRGKRLTDLEALKGFLMYATLLHVSYPQDDLDWIQRHFTEIYRIIERLNEKYGAPQEDSILAYYCVGFTAWEKDEWRNPKKLAKKMISERAEQQDNQATIEWIREFVAGLAKVIKSVEDILGKLGEPNLESFTELMVLGRLAPFWPLLLKIWEKDQGKKFNDLCRLMEIYAFTGYAISNIRADSGQSHLYYLAKMFTDDFSGLAMQLREMCKWYDIPSRFKKALDYPKIYETDSSDVKYFLWKYENVLRLKTGEQESAKTWKEFKQPERYAVGLSIEHISSQSCETMNERSVWWEGHEEYPQLFKDIALHRLGNLVLDNNSWNPSKGNDSFSEKKPKYSKSNFYSQKELVSFLCDDEIDEKGIQDWREKAIKKRHEALIRFAQEEWDPNRIELER